MSNSNIPPNFPWSSNDLRGKTVEFRLSNREVTVSGIGTFLISTSPTAVTRVEIEVIEQESINKKIQRVFTPTPQQVLLIARHPNLSVAEFQLLA